jgi:hypothetical protein
MGNTAALLPACPNTTCDWMLNTFFMVVSLRSAWDDAEGEAARRRLLRAAQRLCAVQQR